MRKSHVYCSMMCVGSSRKNRIEPHSARFVKHIKLINLILSYNCIALIWAWSVDPDPVLMVLLSDLLDLKCTFTNLFQLWMDYPGKGIDLFIDLEIYTRPAHQ